MCFSHYSNVLMFPGGALTALRTGCQLGGDVRRPQGYDWIFSAGDGLNPLLIVSRTGLHLQMFSVSDAYDYADDRCHDCYDERNYD